MHWSTPDIRTSMLTTALTFGLSSDRSLFSADTATGSVIGAGVALSWVAVAATGAGGNRIGTVQ